VSVLAQVIATLISMAQIRLTSRPEDELELYRNLLEIRFGERVTRPRPLERAYEGHVKPEVDTACILDVPACRVGPSHTVNRFEELVLVSHRSQHRPGSRAESRAESAP
jgi:hypothetical protein